MLMGELVAHVRHLTHEVARLSTEIEGLRGLKSLELTVAKLDRNMDDLISIKFKGIGVLLVLSLIGTALLALVQHIYEGK